MKTIFVLIAGICLCVSASAQYADSAMNAKMKLAYSYLKGINKSPNPSKALLLFKECAGMGNEKAMNAIGIQYRIGIGTAADFSQAFLWFTKAANAGYPAAWYNLGLMYKYGTSTERNYEKAYDCFENASSLMDAGGWYAQGYMLYKGIGCKQDYQHAIELFRKGIFQAYKPSCMYMYGLCLRNGFGIAANKDSSRYWLSKAASFGYDWAKDELASKAPENAEGSGILVDQVRAAKNFLAPIEKKKNTYNRILSSIAANDIEGIYEGFLIQYDWSGKFITSTSKLRLNLSVENGDLKGNWLEADTLEVPLSAMLTPKSMIFKNMEYYRKGHNDPVIASKYTFNDAKLQLLTANDSMYLSGSITLFDHGRDEPARPTYMALVRTQKGTNDGLLNLRNDDGSLISQNSLKVYPNPFNDIFNVDFNLTKACDVHTAIFTIDGREVYTNAASHLEAGSYSLPVQAQLAKGTYVMRLYTGKTFKSFKIIKQ